MQDSNREKEIRKQEMRTDHKKSEELTKEKLLAALREAQKEILDLQAQLAEYKWVEEALRKRTRELGERVKELDCLYSISDSLRYPEVSIEQVLDNIVNKLPRGYQCPERTGIRLTVAGQEFCSRHFRETSYCQSADIHVLRARVGIIQVFVSLPPDPADKPTFLPEEDSLLKVVAVWIGEIIEHRSHLCKKTLREPNY